MRASQRLLVKLREFGLDLPEGSRLVRVYGSSSNRTQGAWSWYAIGPTARELGIGSQYPMSELLKAEYLSAFSDAGGDLTIQPVSYTGPDKELG